MNDNFIVTVSRFSNKTEKRRKIISLLGNISPYIIFVLYGVFSFVELFIRKFNEPEFFIIPLIVFAVVTVIRKKLNGKRPFELYDIPRLISHENGEGFPSRHSACCVTISFAILTVCSEAAVLAFIVSAVICATRVLCGVHFVKDVLAGIVSGSILWIIWFIIQAGL